MTTSPCRRPSGRSCQCTELFMWHSSRASVVSGKPARMGVSSSTVPYSHTEVLFFSVHSTFSVRQENCKFKFKNNRSPSCRPRLPHLQRQQLSGRGLCAAAPRSTRAPAYFARPRSFGGARSWAHGWCGGERRKGLFHCITFLPRFSYNTCSPVIIHLFLDFVKYTQRDRVGISR